MELKEIRKNGMITQSDAAKLLNIPLRTYVRYENEKHYIGTFKYEILKKLLLDHLKVDEENGVLTIEQIKNSIITILKQYEVEYCYLFGSYAKHKATETSDVDLLVNTKTTGLKFYGLVEELRNALHKSVDLIRVVDLKDNIELLNEILKDGIKLHG